jgi:UDP-N-acetylmuramyl pentapeptide phosphotransferase/UDP-N-acetylglucosamine-1-phosphate transferase
VLPVLLLSACGSAVLTWLAIDYGRRRGLLDLPGRRRSHQQATPRGGGVAPVTTVLVVLVALGLAGVLQARDAVALGVALFGIASIGWADDHRALGAGLRLAVHAGVAVWLVSLLLADAPLALWLPAAIAIVGAVNAGNFMDGINGIAASQAALIGAVLGWLLWPESPGPALLAWALASACCGFLPFNFPRARVFLGDVGSGALGLLVAALLLLAWRDAAAGLTALLLLPSAFLLDAGLTLLRRAIAGRRLTQAHREHLYQWLVRSGADHASVTLGYAGWTLLMALLCIALPEGSLWLVLAAYGTGGLLWWRGRRRLLARRCRRGRR